MKTAILCRKVGKYTVMCDARDNIIAVLVYDGMRMEYREPFAIAPLYGKMSLKGKSIKCLRRAIKLKLPIDISKYLCYNK